jgi:uncharacterized protein (TIGR02246 family)
MRTTVTLIGCIVAAGAGLALAAGLPQQRAGGQAAPPAPTPPAASAQPGANSQEALIDRAEVKPIVEAIAAFTKVYGTADAKILNDFFTDDVVLVDPQGTETRGKAAVASMYAASFQETPGLRLESRVREVRYLTPDVARVEGDSRLASAGADATEFNRFSALLVRRDGKWRTAEIRELAAPAADITPYERLRELEWMVGDWVDESENNKVTASVRWADNQSYLVRTYAVEIQGEKASSGTQFIGWDPQSGQIKSWVFDSEGGHGEALWTHTEPNKWVLKAEGVLRDGRPSSATQIHTIINKDSVKSSSVDRIIGGQTAPDIVDLVMVRKPPQPGAATPSGAPKPTAATAVAPKTEGAAAVAPKSTAGADPD